MNYDKVAETLNTHPVAQELLNARIPMRLAYIALDGTPRAIPISYLWDGKHFVIVSPPDWPKVKALRAHPQVAFTVDDASFFPPHNLLVRGVVESMEDVPTLPQVYIDASRRIVGEDKFAGWLEEVRRNPRPSTIIRIRPTFVKVIDFESKFPGPSPRKSS
jgi:hypothetical protein